MKARGSLASLVGAAMLVLAACGPGADRAGAASTPAGYEEAATALDAAIKAKDKAALERLIADDLLWVRGSGAKGNKDSFVTALTAGSMEIRAIERSEARWILTTDSALLAATNTLRGIADGEAFVDRHRFADHWVWRDGRWRLVLAQVTPAPASE